MDRRSIPLRLTLVDPPAGVAYSLLDRDNAPVDSKVANGGDLHFDFAVDLAGPPAEGRFLGEHVRNQNGRRFVYFGIGCWAGQEGSPWSRRGKLWLDTLPEALAEGNGARLEARVLGKGRDGTPACASVPLFEPWRPLATE